MNRFLAIQGLIALLLLIAATFLFSSGKRDAGNQQIEATRLMNESLLVIETHARKHNLIAAKDIDPWQTGLIGPEWSEITTTVGHPEAKRTTLNPAWAQLMVKLMREAGVKGGDTIALGCSGSFPALMIAALSAARAMQLHTRTIVSVGSSSFGASNPQFTILDIYAILYEEGLVTEPLAGCSPGGDEDLGSGFDPAVRDELINRLNDSGIRVILEPHLPDNVQKRMKIYEGDRPGSVKLFVSTGGSLPNLGSSAMALTLRPGLIRKARMPDPLQRGMTHTFIDREVPVIHLLNIRQLASRYDIPWDPVTRPGMAPTSIPEGNEKRVMKILISLLFLSYFAWIMVRAQMLKNSP